jgi:hypothetical protein
MKRTGDACLVSSTCEACFADEAPHLLEDISNQGKGEAIMFATRMTMTPLGEAIRQQHSPALLVLVLVALNSLLVLLSGCGSRNALAASVAQAQSVRHVRVHLAPAPTVSTTMRSAQRHLYTFSSSNVGLMQLHLGSGHTLKHPCDEGTREQPAHDL